MRSKRSKGQKDSTLGARLSSVLQRPMRSADEPADSEPGYNCRVWLRFNLVAQPCFERRCILPNNIGSFAVDVLSFPCGLIHDAFNFGFRIAGCPADALRTLPPTFRTLPSSRFSSMTNLSVRDWTRKGRLLRRLSMLIDAAFGDFGQQFVGLLFLSKRSIK